MSLAQVVRQVDMVRQTSRQAHLGLDYEATLGEKEDQFTWRLRVNAAPCTDPWVVLASDDRSLAIAVHSFRDMRLIGERSWTDFHDDARLMAWTLQHEALIEQLGQLTDRYLSTDALIKNPAAHDPALDGPFISFEVRDPDDQPVSRGTLAVDDQDFDHLIGNAEKIVCAKLPKRWVGVPVPLVLRTTPLTLTADTLRSCHPGDVIVLGHHARLHEHLRAFHANGRPLPLRCSVVGRGVEVTYERTPSSNPTPPREELPAMSKADAESADISATDLPNGSSLPTHQIPVQLCVQTGSVEVTLSDLEGLEAGVVLPLNAPLAGTNVTILVNGAPLGDGELVAAGDKLGVCIKRWRPDGL